MPSNGTIRATAIPRWRARACAGQHDSFPAGAHVILWVIDVKNGLRSLQIKMAYDLIPKIGFGTFRGHGWKLRPLPLPLMQGSENPPTQHADGRFT